MKNIVYYVAGSLDGFIAGKDDDVSQFVYESEGVNKYLTDLKDFDTVIMGRKTYEFGYNFGIEAGQPSYANMNHYIFSNHLSFDTQAPNVHVKKLDLQEIEQIREQSATDIYLCGGGELAGWLLENQQIDFLKIKLNPVILGEGTRLFGDSQKSVKLELISTEIFDKGLQILTYQIHY